MHGKINKDKIKNTYFHSIEGEKNRTKIIATIGPKVADKKQLLKLYKAGMAIARLNGSHNSLNWHEKTIKLINNCLPDVPILFDIPGKKIRTCNLIKEPEFKKNDIIVVIFPDHGYRYLSKIYSDKWMETQGFFDSEHEKTIEGIQYIK